MPATYNPEEIARAKHFVALAEQINAKLDRRLPRFVSFSYADIVGNDLLLDINANSWTIKFSALSASFRIISVHEDGAPTITFSNGVTSSNIVSNGSTFTTTITLPSASLTSFTMTVSFPQTATFNAWSKTFNVDTALDKTVPNITLYYSSTGSASDVSTFVAITSSVANVPTTAFSENNALALSIGISSATFQALPTITLPTGYGIRYYMLTFRIDPSFPRIDLPITTPSKNPQTFNLDIHFSETENFAAWSGAYTINIVEGA